MTVWSFPDSRIVRVVDGDSLIGQLTRDIGFHATVTYLQKLRLNRINCPPAHTDAGKEAAMFTRAFTTDARGPFHIDSVGPYKYGDEWMAEITDPTGLNLSDALVTNGFAVYWDGTGPRPGG